MPILRQALMPTVGTPESIVAPQRRKRNMLDPGFYEEDPYKIKTQQAPETSIQETIAYTPSQARDKENQGFIDEPVTGNYLQEQLGRYRAKAALPELLPGARVRSANAQLVDPSSFQGYYEQLNQIGAIGDAQVSAASSRAAHQRLAAMQASMNTGSNTGGSSSSGTPFNGSGDVGSWINQAAQVLSQYGVQLSDADKSYIQTMIQHESGGNPNAINNWDSNAAAGIPSKGLMQTIDPTFNAHKIPGYDNVYDPVANIIAGVRYSISRYGSLANVPGIAGLNNGSGYVGY